MIVKFELDSEKIESAKKKFGLTDEEVKFVEKSFNTYETDEWYGANALDIIQMYSKESFSCEMTSDYGYAINAASIQKYLEKYRNTPEKYAVEVFLLDMEHEKYYKFGSFIDIYGNNTENDFWSIDDYEKLKNMAQCEGRWIQFTVYRITDTVPVPVDDRITKLSDLIGFDNTFNLSDESPAYTFYDENGVGHVKTAVAIRLKGELPEILWCDEHCESVWESVGDIDNDECFGELIDAIIESLEQAIDEE